MTELSTTSASPALSDSASTGAPHPGADAATPTSASAGDVLAVLEQSSSGWHLLHHQRTTGKQPVTIDHIAVGPGGIFVIDAHSWTPELSRALGSEQTAALESALAVAAEVRSLVPPLARQYVLPLLTYVDTNPMSMLRGTMRVCTTSMLAAAITAPRKVMSPAETADVATALAAALRPDPRSAAGAGAAKPGRRFLRRTKPVEATPRTVTPSTPSGTAPTSAALGSAADLPPLPSRLEADLAPWPRIDVPQLPDETPQAAGESGPDDLARPSVPIATTPWDAPDLSAADDASPSETWAADAQASTTGPEAASTTAPDAPDWVAVGRPPSAANLMPLADAGWTTPTETWDVLTPEQTAYASRYMTDRAAESVRVEPVEPPADLTEFTASPADAVAPVAEDTATDLADTSYATPSTTAAPIEPPAAEPPAAAAETATPAAPVPAPAVRRPPGHRRAPAKKPARALFARRPTEAADTSAPTPTVGRPADEQAKTSAFGWLSRRTTQPTEQSDDAIATRPDEPSRPMNLSARGRQVYEEMQSRQQAEQDAVRNAVSPKQSRAGAVRKLVIFCLIGGAIGISSSRYDEINSWVSENVSNLPGLQPAPAPPPLDLTTDRVKPGKVHKKLPAQIDAERSNAKR